MSREIFYPKVTVIITTYKGTDNLARAIDSVITQTYKNTEVIVVDDNGLGTETQLETEKIINRHYSDKVIYIPHDVNKNGSAARNTGMLAATGDYIALLDDDDAFLPEKIELQIKRISETGATVSYTGICVHHEDGRIENVIPNKEGKIFNDVIFRRIQAPSSVLLFSKDAAMRINGFDESFRRHQDWEFLDRLSVDNSICMVEQACINRYIERRNSAKSATQFERNRIFYLEKMKEYIELLPKKQQKELYYHHYFDISKECLKYRNCLKAMHYAIKSGRPLKAFIDMLKAYSIYKKR